MRLRHGFTLIEMVFQIGMVGMVLGLGHTLLLGMLKDARPAANAPLLTDLACDRLRRDLVSGARITEGELVAGGHRWNTSGQRDDADTPGVRALAWRQDGATWLITVTPPAGPVRTVQVTP